MRIKHWVKYGRLPCAVYRWKQRHLPWVRIRNMQSELEAQQRVIEVLWRYRQTQQRVIEMYREQHRRGASS